MTWCCSLVSSQPYCSRLSWHSLNCQWSSVYTSVFSSALALSGLDWTWAAAGEIPLQSCYLLLNKSAASDQTRRAETKNKSGSVEAKGAFPNLWWQQSSAETRGGRARGTRWDRLRRHICVRTTCHSEQWLWQKAMRSAKWREGSEADTIATQAVTATALMKAKGWAVPPLKGQKPLHK